MNVQESYEKLIVQLAAEHKRNLFNEFLVFIKNENLQNFEEMEKIVNKFLNCSKFEQIKLTESCKSLDKFDLPISIIDPIKNIEVSKCSSQTEYFNVPYSEFENNTCKTTIVAGVKSSFPPIIQTLKRFYPVDFNFNQVYIIGPNFTNQIHYLFIGGCDCTRDGIFQELKFLNYIEDLDLGFGAWELKKLQWVKNLNIVTKMLKKYNIKFKFVTNEWYDYLSKYKNSIIQKQKHFLHLPIKFDCTVFIVKFKFNHIYIFKNKEMCEKVKTFLSVEPTCKLGEDEIFIFECIELPLNFEDNFVTETLTPNEWNCKMIKNMKDEILFDFCYNQQFIKEDQNKIFDNNPKLSETFFFEI